MSDRVDAVVVGAGVIGLACARSLARAGREVVVLERNAAIGQETSSRNSEVIHAGIYYPQGSLKAQLCVRGKGLLYRYCEEYQVPHARCGKLILAAQTTQFPELKNYQQQARRNGVGELRWLDPPDVTALEPAVRCAAGLLSESTGIIDSHAFMESLLGDVQGHGGVLALNTEVHDVRRDRRGISISTGDAELGADWMINATGLSAPELANQIHRGAEVALPDRYFAKGHYYTLSGRSPFQRLVYPVAEPSGLGVHVTLDLAGQARFGPDVVWIDGIDYRFDEANRGRFVEAIRRYYPDLDETRLQPGYTGIRPKIAGPGEPPGDFLILGPKHHQVPGMVHLLGIESPGLTAALAIAEHVAALTGVS